jgi:amidohydrolase
VGVNSAARSAGRGSAARCGGVGAYAREVTIASCGPAKVRVAEEIERRRGDVVELSHRVHAEPELGFCEEKASGWVAEILRDGGFDVEVGVCDMPTALSATFGDGSLTVGICAEYDALPDIGHACGHNVIAAAAVAAGLGLATVAEDLDLTVKVLGCPAEENGGGKVLLLDRGGFAGVHAAMMVHPSPDEDPAPRSLAISDLKATFIGKAAHASGRPYDGINAADALTIAHVAVGLLRQQIRPEERVHGITTRGGEAPNIIPAETSAVYFTRAVDFEALGALEARVRRCFEAGALATGCDLSIEAICPPYSHFEPDADMIKLYSDNSRDRDRPPAKARESLGSTDMANVSLRIPAIQPMIAIDAEGSSNHQPDFARHCAGPSADRAVIDGATIMAATSVDLATTPTIRQRLIAGRRLPHTWTPA